MTVFERLSPFIRDFIYREGWETLHPIQVAACDILWNTDYNLLLTGGTAGGKTEAAFLPILTTLSENPSKSVGILYISPLKALINDQFVRLDALLSESKIKVTKWHGDASVTLKQKLLQKPEGIMQTTPESLEAMLMHRPVEVIKLFSDLRYIIIDEVHAFMNEGRGVQLLCDLERIERLTDTNPVRIGLSATVGQIEVAENWLSTGSKRVTVTPNVPTEHKKCTLAVTHYYVQYKTEGTVVVSRKNQEDLFEAYYNELYKVTYGRKCIIFSNSKAEVETNIANLKKIARKNNAADVYMVHHGNVSAKIREYVEDTMKADEIKTITGASVTLELGIDVGALERIVQTGTPLSVSGFVQRLGRSGRRQNRSEMWFLFNEDITLSSAEFFRAANWNFLMCIAIIELYTKDNFVEPPCPIHLPYDILFHQTMSFMASSGEVTAGFLAQHVLTLSPFKEITLDDYRLLLRSMLQMKIIEKTEDNTLMVGEAGEYLINSFDFYSVFDVPSEFSVICGSEDIGTVQQEFPLETRFALAGRSFEVTEIDKARKILYVKLVPGISSNAWYGYGGAVVHTRVMQKMREVIIDSATYGYLYGGAATRLSEIRSLLQNVNICTDTVVKISNNVTGIFPFLGTRELMTLFSILSKSNECELYMDRTVPVAIFVKNKSLQNVRGQLSLLKGKKITESDLVLPEELALSGKYQRYVPYPLQLKEYMKDKLSF